MSIDDMRDALRYRPTLQELREAMIGMECLHYVDLACRQRSELPEDDPRRRNAHQSDWCAACRENEAYRAEQQMIEKQMKKVPHV